MSKNYVQDGKTVEWVNGTGKTVLSGELVVQDNLTGVAHADIPDGTVGVLHTAGVFSLPKEAEALTQGKLAYFKADTATLTATKTGNTLVGTVWGNAETSDATVCVRLGY
ncbi:hypothetical membrane protein from phage origin [Escherichia coli]|uniref:DUF2190 family protein n=1 Tax=Escherichia coli TaxID=562 RepID=UPI0010CBDDBE|nr:DUF2190 family protein [Escherichia coli]EEV6001968.1 DUF2190 family protein [Escherichia coli]EFN7178254.1 DUF2190 family protein [Escherichia coli]EIM8566626.1 DUF2190 family protein [Escherichia coli]EIQ0380220.1 DUF2190 family protein [Escherichia coli]MBS9050658.1 DUF2190 family protein [Escherichia coli]